MIFYFKSDLIRNPPHHDQNAAEKIKKIVKRPVNHLKIKKVIAFASYHLFCAEEGTRTPTP